MKTTTYKEMSQTAEGRKELHNMMLNEVKAKLDALVESAPAANRDALAKMMDTAYNKIATLGNADLFSYFADENVSQKNFISYVNDAIQGNI